MHLPKGEVEYKMSLLQITLGSTKEEPERMLCFPTSFLHSRATLCFPVVKRLLSLESTQTPSNEQLFYFIWCKITDSFCL